MEFKAHEDADKATVRPDLPAAADIAVFGPFRLRVAERVLEKDAIPVKIGSRAFDILVTLLRSMPEVVSHRELMSSVWGGLIVDEGNLRLQISALRKALGDSALGSPYVTNVPARGYCFTGAVEWTSAAPAAPHHPPPPSSMQLPRRPRQMVGRDREVASLIQQLRTQRFVSIVGAAGIGKTTIALAVAHEVHSEFAGSVQFLDLTTIRDPQLIGSTLAARLGLTVISNDALPVILDSLRERRILLVLDNCEHLVEAVAKLVEALFLDAPEVHILATSRESLRAEGESVYHLPALDCPPPAVNLTASQALAYPSVQLFVKQAAASGYPFELDDEGAPIVSELCRRLDGIALALELAACRVGVYGLQRIVSLLDDQFRLLWRGRRTALPRHQTLRAALDWSYNLLSQREQLVLRRLSIFVGGFALEDALAVAGEDLDSAEVTEIVAALVDKSLVTLDPTVSMRYRLLDTTRSYARQELDENGERAKVARRHCEYLCSHMERFGVNAAEQYRPEAATFLNDRLSEVQAAQEWSFSAQGEAKLGLRLVAACAPLYFQLSLLPECIASTQRALSSLDDTSRGTHLELKLQVCLGASLLYSKEIALARAAVERGLQLAAQLDDAVSELLLLHALYTWGIRRGDFRELIQIANRFQAAALRIRDPLADAMAQAITASAFHYSGDVKNAPKLAQAALSSRVHSSKLNAASFVDFHNASNRTNIAEGMWYLGYPEQALAMATEARRAAADSGNPRTMAPLICRTLFVDVRTGEWPTADALIEQLLALVARYRFATYVPVGLGWRGYLAVLRGDYSRGLELLDRAITELRAYDYGLYIRTLSAALAEGYAAAGRLDLARTTVKEAIAWSEDRGPATDHLELVRVKGEILQSEECLLECLQLAQSESLLSMELRIGMSLASLWADRGMFDKAQEVLTSIYGRFTEGFNTRDLMAATDVLAAIRRRASNPLRLRE